MITAEDLGRKAFHLKPEERERLQRECERGIEAEVATKTKEYNLKLGLKAGEEAEIIAQLKVLGSVPEAKAREVYHNAIYQVPLILFCAVGDFIFARWCISYLSLGEVPTLFVAGMLVVISLHGFDLYLTSLRTAFPDHHNHFMLALGCLALILIFLFIFFTADLRQAVHQMAAAVSLSNAPEDLVRRAEEFHKTSGDSFIWLMVTLGTAFLLVGGVSYHEAKNRYFFYGQYLKLYQKLRMARMEKERIAEWQSAAEATLGQFRTGFQSGLAKEAAERATPKHVPEAPKSAPHAVEKKKARFVPYLFAPPVLMAIALAIFLLLFRGKAHGAENLVFIDISRSVSAPDYTGKQTEFQKNIKGVEDFIRNHISPGDSVKVMAITESTFSRPYVLIDTRISDQKGQFGERLAQEKLRLLKSWNELNLKPSAEATDVLGALSLAAILFPQTADKKNLIIFSDMRHCAVDINLEKQKKIDADATLAKVKQTGLIAGLQGVRVWCLGVDSAGVTPEYWSSLREFWAKVFNRTGAKLVAFTIERRFQNE